MDFDSFFIKTHRALFDYLELDTRDRFIFIPEHAITWNQEQDVDHLAKLLKDHKKTCLLEFDTNPSVMFDSSHPHQYLLDLTTMFDGQVQLLSYNLKDFFESSQEIYFPYFLLQQRQEKNHQAQDKKYRFSFLSNQPRFHRLWLYQQVKKSITDDDCFAVHFDPNKSPDHNFVMSYCQQVLGTWQDLSSDLPFFHPHANDSFAQSLPVDRSLVDWSNSHNAYRAVYNITGESTFEDGQIFFTEKTWKSIRSRCLTINFGAQHANHYLQQLGFQTDHDVDLPLQDKVQWINELMSRTTVSDALDRSRQYKDLIEHNFQRFYSHDLLRLFRDYLRDKLKI